MNIVHAMINNVILDEYNEYKEFKEKLTASKENKSENTSEKKLNTNVLPRKNKSKVVQKDDLPNGATYPKYEEPVIIDKPQKKELGAKISAPNAPKKERGITTQRKNGITGGR